MHKPILLLCIFVFTLESNEKLKRFNVAYMANSMTNYSKKDLKIAMNLWLQEISKEVGYEANMFFYDDPQEAVKDLESKKIDYISAFPLVYVKYFDINLLEDGFSGGLENPENDLFIVLVKNNKNINSWQDIKDPKVGIQKNDEVMYLYSKYKTANKNLDIKAYSNRTRTILDLFFNKLDIAIVPHRNFILAKELNPQIAKKVKILEITKINAGNLGFFRKTLDDEIKKDVYKEAVKIYDTPKGHQMMMIYKADKMVDTKISDLKEIQIFYEKYKKFEKTGSTL